ncbi:hypothetical protein J6A64_07620 [bacterium]|nr:hypothetical protein [bacterium]MBO5447492.1 hypothetical protein [bacterium]
MKKLAIVLALMLVQTQVLAAEATNNANVEKKPAQQVQATQQQAQQQSKTPSQVQKDEEYLLKYNIRDLEAAPWLHGGKRSYN